MGIERAIEGHGFRWRPEGDANPVVEAFHAVRRMTYASTGSRDPADLVRERHGACTAKHLLLAQLLDSLGVPVRVRCLAGAFGLGLPEAPDMPDELKAMIREGGVPDVHNVVVAEIDGRETLLDATWHDEMIAVGFPVNDRWNGVGDTKPALQGTFLEHDGDLVAFKASQLSSLPSSEQQRRLRFLELITQYSAARPNKGETQR